MTLWIVLTGLTALVAVFLAIPLARRFDAPKSEGALVVAMSRDQLAEVEADRASGTLSEREAEEARHEIERRTLAAIKEDGGAFRVPSERGTLIATAIVTGWVVVGATVLYALMGRPDLPSAARQASAIANPPRAETAAAATSGTPAAPAAAGQAGTSGSVEEMIASLRARLEEDPEDAEGWRMLGWSYFNTERYGQAAEAYGRSTELDPSDPDVWSAYGEVLVRGAGGLVNHDALTAFDAALERNPDDPRARFFKGMALEQAGDIQGALDAWVALARSAGDEADWRPGVITRIEELAAASNVDLGDKLAGLSSAETAQPAGLSGNLLPPATSQAPGPTAEDVAAAADMDAEDRNAMIQGMVARLAARLEDNPDDPEGWVRLIRSRMVLGDKDGAQAALGSARDAFADDPGKLGVVLAGAQTAGLVVE